jgi:DNA-binding transcriptional ArsR family regulator
MADIFDVISDPTRRDLLQALLERYIAPGSDSGEISVGELVTTLGLSQPTVSKHLRVLRDAGFVECTIDAQRRLYRLNPEPLQELDAWLAPFRRFWSAHVDALERHLDRMARSGSTKRKTRRRR